MNLVTHKAGAKGEPLFNKPASVQRSSSKAGLLNKSSCLAPTLGVTKFIIVTGSHFAVLLKSDLDVQQTKL